MIEDEADRRNTERETRILDAAARLITHYGYDKTSVDEIAREAGISKGAVYLHFRSKEAVLDAVLLRATSEMMHSMFARVDADPAGLTVFTLYRYGIIAWLENPLLHAVFTRDRRVLGRMTERMDQLPMGANTLSISMTFVRQMQAASLIRADVQPEVVAAIMLAMRQGVLHLDLSDPNMPSLEVLGETLSTMMQAAFGTEHGSSEEGKQLLWNLIVVAREALAQTYPKESTS